MVCRTRRQKFINVYIRLRLMVLATKFSTSRKDRGRGRSKGLHNQMVTVTISTTSLRHSMRKPEHIWTYPPKPSPPPRVQWRQSWNTHSGKVSKKKFLTCLISSVIAGINVHISELAGHNILWKEAENVLKLPKAWNQCFNKVIDIEWHLS